MIMIVTTADLAIAFFSMERLGLDDKSEYYPFSGYNGDLNFGGNCRFLE